VAGRFSNLEFDAERCECIASAEKTRLHGNTAHDYVVRAHEEYRWGRFEPALRLYTRALREDRAAIPAWVGQVQMLVQLGECHEARVWSDKAREVFRTNGELLAAKAQACVRLHDVKAGLACSDASLQAPGSSSWRWQVRGEALLAQRQKYAEECFQKAVCEPAADWFDRVVIARINLFYDRLTNGLHYLKQAMELEPTHGYVWFEMGNCQAALGLVSAAENSYGRCLELRPEYEEARRALEALPAGPSLRAWARRIFRAGRHR